MKYLLKNGTVISGAGTRKQDVLVEGEKIIKVGEELSQPDAKVVDVSGKLLFPGFIDGHTHFDLEVAGTVTADDFETGTTIWLHEISFISFMGNTRLRYSGLTVSFWVEYVMLCSSMYKPPPMIPLRHKLHTKVFPIILPPPIS